MVAGTPAFLVAGAIPADAAPPPPDPAQQLGAAQNALDLVVEQYDTAREKLGRTIAARDAATRALAPYAGEVNALRDEVSRYSSTLYKNAGGRGMTALLSAGTPGTLLDELTTLNHIAVVHRRQIDALRAAEAVYAGQRHRLDLLVTQQSAQQASLAAKRTRIEAQIAQLRQLPVAAPAPAGVVSPIPEGVADPVVRYVFAQLGKAYQWGAAGPSTFDCSGLTMAAWRAAGVSLPHSAAMQWAGVEHLSRDQLQPGDLVFYYSNIHHVAMYIGNGKVIHAPTFGRDVTIAPIDLSPIYGYGRPRR
jgi:cell wall-associated NlpC family hydrolase